MSDYTAHVFSHGLSSKTTSNFFFFFAACDCDPRGAVSELCDQVRGQCACRMEVAGRRCDRCQAGYWGFPLCQPCECNSLSEICDEETGECLDCREHSTGPQCERSCLHWTVHNYYYLLSQIFVAHLTAPALQHERQNVQLFLILPIILILYLHLTILTIHFLPLHFLVVLRSRKDSKVSRIIPVICLMSALICCDIKTLHFYIASKWHGCF